MREDHIHAAQPVTVRGRTRDPGQRHLCAVVDRIELPGADDLMRALRSLPPEPFSTRELAAVLGCGLVLAQRTAYCLRAAGLVEVAGKRGRSSLHRRAQFRAP